MVCHLECLPEWELNKCHEVKAENAKEHQVLRTEIVPTLTCQLVPNQEYGKAAMQQRAQQAVPMAQAPNVAASAPQAQQRPSVVPGSLPYIAPTQRPTEPITAGIDVGPGPGSEAISPPPAGMLTGVFKNLSRDPHATSATFDIAATARAFGL